MLDVTLFLLSYLQKVSVILRTYVKELFVLTGWAGRSLNKEFANAESSVACFYQIQREIGKLNFIGY